MNVHSTKIPGSDYDLRSTHLVKTDADVPKSHHLAILWFTSESEWTPGYDVGEGGYSSSVTRTNYLAFTNQEVWTKAIEILSLAHCSFVAMKVDGVAKVNLRAVVEMEVA